MKGESPPRLVLSEARHGQLCSAFRELGSESFEWAYVGQSLPRMLDLRNRLGADGRIDFGGRFHRTVAATRDDYIEFVGALSARNHSLLWWIGWIAEKNPWFSKAFLHIAYAITCLDLIRERGRGDRPLLLVVESRSVIRTVAQNLPQEVEVTRFEGRQLVDSVFATVRAVARHLGAAVLYTSRILYGRLSGQALAQRRRAARSSSQQTVLLTWIVDTDQFKSDGTFQDRYFPGLARRARQRGTSVVTTPLVFGRTSYRQVATRMRSSAETFLFPASVLRVRDVWSAAVRSALGPGELDGKPPPFRGLDVTAILRAEVRADRRHHRTIRALLLHAFPARLREHGISVDRVLLPFENHIWARGFLHRFRKEYPNAKAVGYQHSSVPSLVLNFFIADREKDLAPLPDQIVSNGERPACLLRNSGYPSHTVKVGPALRFQDVLEELNRTSQPPSAGERMVLVAPSIGEEESGEVVWKALEAYSSDWDPGLRVVIKCHPLRQWEQIAATLGVSELPPRMKVSTRPLSSLLEAADAFVYSTTSGVLEACAIGVPSIHIRPEFDLDFDPLDAAPEARLEAHTVEELRAVTERLFAEDALARELRERGRSFLRRVLSPVTDEACSALLG